MQRAFEAPVVLLLVWGIWICPAGAADPQWDLAEVQRGAAEVTAIANRRLDYSTTYRLARGHLEKNVHSGKDSNAFQLGAQLALTHWLARLPQDTAWRAKALARHRDVTHWIAQDSTLPPPEVAHAAALGLNLAKSDEGWLLGILKGEPEGPLRPQPTPSAAVDQ